MTLTIINENTPAFSYLKSEANGHRSRDVFTIDQNQTLNAGTVLGQVEIGALSVAAALRAGAVGNFIPGAWTAAAGTPLGEYIAECVDAAGGGVFRLEGPTGEEIGEIKMGVAFNAGGLAGTLTAGGVAAAPGDVVTFTVTDVPPANAGNYVALNPAATDGSQNFAGICGRHTLTGAGQTDEVVGHTRECEVWAERLDYGSLTNLQIAAVNAQMAAKGIIVR